MTQITKAADKCKSLGVDVWRADQYVTTTLSVRNSAEALENPETLKEVTEIIAKAHGVHPSWVEYDESTPEFIIKCEANLLNRL